MMQDDNLITVEFTAEESLAIANLAIDTELPEQNVVKQALRHYQLHRHRLMKGETHHWSGDAERAADFAGPLLSEIPTLEQLTDMRERIEAASAYQAARGNRQILYQLVKLIPSYRAFYEEAEGLYNRLCAAMGVEPEPVFDEEEYKKSQRYQDLVSGKIA